MKDLTAEGAEGTNGDKILMGYDQFGRITSVTNENLHATKYAYDNLSQ
ncbi:MAG: hypothetical protein P2A85_20065 [Microcoleus anatoxicus]